MFLSRSQLLTKVNKKEQSWKDPNIIKTEMLASGVTQMRCPARAARSHMGIARFRFASRAHMGTTFRPAPYHARGDHRRLLCIALTPLPTDVRRVTLAVPFNA